MAYDSHLLIALERVVRKELTKHSTSVLRPVIHVVFRLKCTVPFQLNCHYLSPSVSHILVCCSTIALCEQIVEILLLGWHDDRLGAPELRLCHRSDSREVKRDAMADVLPRRILLDKGKRVHGDVIHRVHNLMDPRLDNEADVGLVWVALKHVNARLHRTLHRGDKNSLNI